MEFRVIQGDIAEQSADAIVNAANTDLRMGSGVAGALREKGGEELNEAAVRQGGVELGGVAVTDAYGLDAEFVIHAATMPPGGSATSESIRDATRNALAKADELDCDSIVLPALGCGVAGFDFEHGVHVICETIATYDPENLDDVRLIAYSDDEHDQMERIADEYQ